MSAKQPGRLTEINGIPTAIVNGHQEAQYYRQLLDIRNAKLIMFDAHSDHLSGCPVFTSDSGLDYWEGLSCDNHVAAGLHSGNLSEMYWVNPFTGILASLRSSELDEKKGRVFWKGNKTSWDPFKPPVNWVYMPDTGTQIHEYDMDGFCTNDLKTKIDLKLDGVKEDSVEGWEKRVDWSMGMASHANKPDLVVIVRSQGNRFARKYKERVAYVPRNKVDEIQEYLIAKLEETYTI